MAAQILTQESLKQEVNYNKETGIFTRIKKSAPSVSIGDIAGDLTNEGYRRLSVCGKQYQAHRLAWLYVYGFLPSVDLDHINGIRDDNRICNLRLATRSKNNQNQRNASINNKSGYLGVCFHKKQKKWLASITKNRKQKYIGLFDTPELAHEAYLMEKRKIHEYCTI